MGDIIPAILPKTPDELIERANTLPLEIPFVHLDVLEEEIWAPINKEFEAHLMVESPEIIMEKWIGRGAKRIIVHKINDEILKYRERAEIGLGVEMSVPIEEVLAFSSFADFIHLMSIDEIGEQGHPLDEKVIERVKAIQAKFPEITISVDGGINVNNFEKLLEAGADRLVVGTGFRDLWNKLRNG